MSSERPERRLHPLSFLFTLLAQLRQFIFPLVAAFFLGQSSGRNQGDEYALVAVAIVTLVSLAQYFTYRYRIEDDAIVVRSGVFERTRRTHDVSAFGVSKFASIGYGVERRRNVYKARR